jgi:hypothetical protein
MRKRRGYSCWDDRHHPRLAVASRQGKRQVAKRPQQRGVAADDNSLLTIGYRERY